MFFTYFVLPYRPFHMPISFSEYKDFTARTWAPAPVVNSHDADVLHAILGLSGENLELQLTEDGDDEHIEEELSDLMYYMVRLGSIVGYDGDPLPEKEMEWEVQLENFINQAKKSIFYRHEVNLFDAYLCLLRGFHDLLESHEYEWEEIQTVNHEKLSRRYPNGFSSEDAANRADKRDTTDNPSS